MKRDPVKVSYEQWQVLDGLAKTLRKLNTDFDHQDIDDEKYHKDLVKLNSDFEDFLDEVSQAASMQWAAIDKIEESKHWHVYSQADPGALPDNAATFDNIFDATEFLEEMAQIDRNAGSKVVLEDWRKYRIDGVRAIYVEKHDDPDCELWQEFLAERDNERADGSFTGES